MKNAYRWVQPLLAALLLLIAGRAGAQTAWRPFRPGLIYSFTTPAVGPNAFTGSYLLRVDSAYVTAAGDSAWAFNRVLRPVDGNAMSARSYTDSRKSRNNLFGARLTWQLGTSEFVLENLAEGSYQAALSLRLRPRAAVGSTWTASTAPAVTATLTGRAWQPVTGVAGSPSDSVATIALSSGATLRLSRRYGLLEGPRWLAVSGGTAPQWVADRLPMTLAASPLNPAKLFDMQPGDLLGYFYSPLTLGGMPCQEAYILRAVQARQVVGDSLIYTYREQVRTQTYFPGCGSPVGNQTSAVATKRVAFSLRTGQSPQYSALSLLSGEYKNAGNAPQNQTLTTGLGIIASTGNSCLTGNEVLLFQQRYPRVVNGQTLYAFASDGNWEQQFGSAGLGDVRTYETSLIYARRATPGSGVITCGSPINFVGLLPTRAAQAAAIATVHPNPAAGQATLTLAAAVPSGAALRLTDALGRTVWTAPVPAGRTTVPVPLAGQPAGLYLLHLSGPGGTSATWKLLHE